MTGLDPTGMLAVLLGAALGGAVLLLIAGIRGVPPRGTRPPSRAARLLAALRTTGGRRPGWPAASPPRC